MSVRRFRPTRVDENQRAIVRALEGVGCTVEILSAVGKGCPDLLVGVRGRTILLEVKRDEKAARINDATRKRQREWVARWRGGIVATVTSPESAVAAVIYLETTSKDAPGSRGGFRPEF